VRTSFQTIALFLDAGMVDEFMIHSIPAMPGKGIPPVAAKRRSISLTL
jgi:hypothetical protein